MLRSNYIFATKTSPLMETIDVFKGGTKMEILHKGALHIGTKVKITCPYCGTIVQLIQYEPNTDIEVEQNGINGKWQAKHVIYTCPVCDTRIVSNHYDRRLLDIGVLPDQKLTQDEVNLVHHPDLLDDETKITVS